MKRVFYLLLYLGVVTVVKAQTDRDAMREEMRRFREGKKAEMSNFRDSINREYARFLAEKWEEFNLIRQDMVFKPMPKPPVYTPVVKPVPEEKDDDKEKEKTVVKPPVSTPAPKPDPVPQPVPASVKKLKGVFFGTEVSVRAVDWKVFPLSDTSERSISANWKALASMDFKTMVEDVARLKAELRLDDWGTYQLLTVLCKVYSSSIRYNDGVVFSVFLLNQMGYQAKIGRSDDTLYPLLAIRENVFNAMHFTIGGNTKYYVLAPDHKMPSNIMCCAMDFKTADKKLSLAVKSLPVVGSGYKQKLLTFAGRNYCIDYNPQLCSYFSTYPCADFSVYAKAAMDDRTLKCLENQLYEELKGKTEVQAVNLLLHFVQNAFNYKTDDAQYGYEKWNFPEETIIAPYSDCDDRAILFAQLVRRLLGLDVALVYYPGVHLATAVAFNVPVNGTSVTSGNKKYVICDPTYINADVGMDMPQLKGTKVDVIPL